MVNDALKKFIAEIPCPVQNCYGLIVWYGDYERSKTGKCLQCKSIFSLIQNTKSMLEVANDGQ